MHFWRTTQQQEIDLVEEVDGHFAAYELKWGKTQKVRFPQTFTENYVGSETFVITPENIEKFLIS